MMTDDRLPDQMDPTFMRQYREEVRRGIERNLRNVYLYNLQGFCENKEVKNAVQMLLGPDEMFMRMVEQRASITDADWRKQVWDQWKAGSTEMLDQRLGQIFRWLAEDYQIVQKALIVYPNDIRIEVTSNGNSSVQNESGAG